MGNEGESRGVSERPRGLMKEKGWAVRTGALDPGNDGRLRPRVLEEAHGDVRLVGAKVAVPAVQQLRA
jgi:hypothetical protein